MKRVQAGVICEVIGGTDNLNVGKQVKVISLQGQHSQLGNIWRCTVVKGEQLVTEYGAVGISADFAQSWLRPIEDEPLPNQAEKHTQRSDPVYMKG